MKNVYEVLRQKELELARLEKEVEALRVVAPLLSDEGRDATTEVPKPTLATTPSRSYQTAPMVWLQPSAWEQFHLA